MKIFDSVIKLKIQYFKKFPGTFPSKEKMSYHPTPSCTFAFAFGAAADQPLFLSGVSPRQELHFIFRGPRTCPTPYCALFQRGRSPVLLCCRETIPATKLHCHWVCVYVFRPTDTHTNMIWVQAKYSTRTLCCTTVRWEIIFPISGKHNLQHYRTVFTVRPIFGVHSTQSD